MPFAGFGQVKSETAANKELLHLTEALKSEYKILRAAAERKDTEVMAHSYGNLGALYLKIAKQPSENFHPGDSVSGDQKININKAIDNLNNSISSGEVTGDISLMKKSYKALSAAQNLAGNVAGALDSYRKMISLKLNSKKALKIEQKQLAYKYGKREDSLIAGKQVVEKHLENKTIELNEKQNLLEKTNHTLLVTERDKELQAANLKLQQSQLDYQKSQLDLAKINLQLQKNELDQKNRDIDQKNRERYFYILGILSLLAISILAYRTIINQKKFNRALVKEKKRSEDLLLNILPAEVAEELKEKGYADAKQFFDVTVLFTDFVSFTSAAELMLPHELVGELHICFKAFDEISGKYQIEKIKTIGDSYMAVSGLPVPNAGHANNIVAAAIEIRNFMQQRKRELGNKTFGIRIGINSGNVVAGIVGARKFSYDIWGDTVNIASRIEQNSEEGKINISETTYQLIKNTYKCIHRGKIEAKNKGSIDMYYLENGI